MGKKMKDYIDRETKEYGDKFDPSELHEKFVRYYENGERITVSFRDKNGNEYAKKRGTIGVSTGWRPCFLLILTKRSLGSSWTIGKNDEVL